MSLLLWAYLGGVAWFIVGLTFSVYADHRISWGVGRIVASALIWPVAIVLAIVNTIRGVA